MSSELSFWSNMQRVRDNHVVASCSVSGTVHERVPMSWICFCMLEKHQTEIQAEDIKRHNNVLITLRRPCAIDFLNVVFMMP